MIFCAKNYPNHPKFYRDIQKINVERHVVVYNSSIQIAPIQDLILNCISTKCGKIHQVAYYKFQILPGLWTLASTI